MPAMKRWTTDVVGAGFLRELSCCELHIKRFFPTEEDPTCLPFIDPLDEFCTVDACTFVCMGMCASSLDVTLLHISNILGVNIGPRVPYAALHCCLGSLVRGGLYESN